MIILEHLKNDYKKKKKQITHLQAENKTCKLLKSIWAYWI